MTRILYPPLAPYFFNRLFDSEREVILVAPYIKYQIANQIVEVLRAAKSIGSVSMTLITNVSASNLAGQSSDIEALTVLMDNVPHLRLVGIGNLHAKCYVFDGSCALVTSGNLSPRGLVHNLEISIELTDSQEVADLRQRILTEYVRGGIEVDRAQLTTLGSEINDYALSASPVRAELEYQDEIKLRAIFASPNIPVSNAEVVAPAITSIISSRSKSVTRLRPVANTISLAERKQNQLLQSIGDRHWLENYELLLAYINDNPRFWPLRSQEYEGVKLGVWCAEQRELNSDNRLPLNKKRALENIGFDFSEESFLWDYRYNTLLDYRDEYPNQWPMPGETYGDIALGEWCRTIRHLHANGGLSKARTQLLDRLGFPWDEVTASWDFYLSRLRQYRRSYPNRWPASPKLISDFGLYEWCLRVAKLHRGGTYDNYYRVLAEIGFPFGNYEKRDNEKEWEQMLALVGRYYMDKAVMPSPGIEYKDRSIGKWLEAQKEQLVKGQLSEKRARMLSAMLESYGKHIV